MTWALFLMGLFATVIERSLSLFRGAGGVLTGAKEGQVVSESHSSTKVPRHESGTWRGGHKESEEY